MAKKKVSPDEKLLAKANSAFEIAGEVQSIVDRIIENGGECDDETLAMLNAWKGAIEIKGNNIAMVVARMEADAEYFKAIEEAAKARRKAREKAKDKLKQYLARCMMATDTKQIKRDDSLFTISLCDGKASVSVENVDKLPIDMVEVIEVVKPKTNEIKEALESGKKINGASLEYGEAYIMIRK